MTDLAIQREVLIEDQCGPVVMEAVEPPARFSFRWNHPRGEEPAAGPG
jgi:hypothetical protein